MAAPQVSVVHESDIVSEPKTNVHQGTTILESEMREA